MHENWPSVKAGMRLGWEMKMQRLPFGFRCSMILHYRSGQKRTADSLSSAFVLKWMLFFEPGCYIININLQGLYGRSEFIEAFFHIQQNMVLR